MSLLLLIPQPIFIDTSWAVVGATSSTWNNTNYDFRDRWGDWGTATWGTLTTGGITWGQMAGFTFANTTGNSTVWIVTT